jgi:hypothetical protein
MNLRLITARTAVAGVTAALAAGALVGITTTAANAVENTTNYDCTAFGASQGSFALNISTPVIPASATAGQSFPGGLLNLDAKVTVPPATASLLSGAGVNGGRIDDFAGGLGTTKLLAPLTFGAPAAQDDGSAVLTGAGSVGAFTLPKAATYKVLLPTAFTFTPTTADGDLTVGGTPVTVSCTTAAPGNLGTVKVTKADATLKAKAAKAGKKGYKVTVTVTRVDKKGAKATGKVTAKYGKKKVTKAVKKGKVVITLPKAAKGKTVKLTYSGDGFIKAAKGSVKIKK